MFVQKLGINDTGHLEMGGCDCVELAGEFGTPLYVIDEEVTRDNCRKYKDALDKYYNGNGLVIYASKALSTIAVIKIVEQEGLGFDVVSGGEIYTALKAGAKVENIFFHGNNKLPEELELAVENNIGRIVVDNLYELNLLSQIAKRHNKIVNIHLRITPGVEAHTHEFIKTGQIDSKFGIPFENGQAFELVREALDTQNINLIGIHCHIGSQIFDSESFEFAAEIMLKFVLEIKDRLNHEILELNLGGGFGIKYTVNDDPFEYEKHVKYISSKIKAFCKVNQIKEPFLILEPGRSIIGSAGITLYTVGSIKDIPGIRKYIAVDGGMVDNPRYALYQSKYECVIANRPDAEKIEIATIAGKCCESGDILLKDTSVPYVKSGEILAVLATGAYNYSMSSNYNRIPKPAMVLVKAGKADIIVKREDYDDIVRNDVVPERLK